MIFKKKSKKKVPKEAGQQDFHATLPPVSENHVDARLMQLRHPEENPEAAKALHR